MLTVVDEFSRFPFAFPCRSTDAETVISCLNQLFALFGMPAYIHYDRGSAFVSHDLISYLHHGGIGCSNTSIYNPRGNGQCENPLAEVPSPEMPDNVSGGVRRSTRQRKPVDRYGAVPYI